MKKICYFWGIVATVFLCMGIGAKAIGRYDSLTTTGTQVLTATAYNDSQCHSGSIIHSYTSGTEIVLSNAYIEVNGSKKVQKKDYKIGNDNPIVHSGVKKKKVHTYAKCSAGKVEAEATVN